MHRKTFSGFRVRLHRSPVKLLKGPACTSHLFGCQISLELKCARQGFSRTWGPLNANIYHWNKSVDRKYTRRLKKHCTFLSLLSNTRKYTIKKCLIWWHALWTQMRQNEVESLPIRVKLITTVDYISMFISVVHKARMGMMVRYAQTFGIFFYEWVNSNHSNKHLIQVWSSISIIPFCGKKKKPVLRLWRHNMIYYLIISYLCIYVCQIALIVIWVHLQTLP